MNLGSENTKIEPTKQEKEAYNLSPFLPEMFSHGLLAIVLLEQSSLKITLGLSEKMLPLP